MAIHSVLPTDPVLALGSLSERFQSTLELGVALEPEHLVDQGDVVVQHFRRISPENAMKWGSLCPSAGCYVWERADAIANFARKHHMRMTGHTLLWHRMQPPWLFLDIDAATGKTTVAERLRDHIFCMVERYSDVVDNWDVVNEAVSDRPNVLWRNATEHSEWYGVFGDERYVELAFRYAAEAIGRFAPKTKLYYNDYDLERSDKRVKVIEMVRMLRGKGVRIDGVGIQGHINLTWPTATELGSAIDELFERQLLVKVSELDISVYIGDDPAKKFYQPAVEWSSELETTLAQRYVDVFSVFVERSKRLTSVVLWGLSDDRSWLNRYPVVRPNYPLLIDRAHHPKLSMKRLLEMSASDTPSGPSKIYAKTAPRELRSNRDGEK